MAVWIMERDSAVRLLGSFLPEDEPRNGRSTQKAEPPAGGRIFRVGPTRDIMQRGNFRRSRLLDHLVGGVEQRQRNGEVDRLRGLEIDG